MSGQIVSSQYNKAITAFLVGLTGLLRDFWGIEIPGLDETAMNAMGLALSVFAVWLIPNRPKPGAR